MRFWKKINLFIFSLVLLSSFQFQEKHWLAFISKEINLNSSSKNIDLIFNIDPGIHIQADEVENSNLIPTEIVIEWPKELELGVPQFPENESLTLKGSEEILQVFSGEFIVQYPLVKARAGTYSIKGKILYQACNDYQCFFPRTLKFSFLLHIE